MVHCKGVARGGLGFPLLWAFFKQTAYSRWQKHLDNLVSNLILSQCDPPFLKNPGTPLHQASAYLHSFNSVKSLGVFSGWDASPSQGYPVIHLCTWVDRATARVKCFAQKPDRSIHRQAHQP